MTKTLLLPKFNITAPTEDYELIIRLDEKYTEENDFLAFIPNRRITSKSKQNFCFIPYGPHSWQYKQQARNIGYELEDDTFIELDTHVTYPLHQKVGLNHNEEMHILMISLLFFKYDTCFNNSLDITLFEKLNMSNKENNFLDEMIKNQEINLFHK